MVADEKLPVHHTATLTRSSSCLEYSQFCVFSQEVRHTTPLEVGTI